MSPEQERFEIEPSSRRAEFNIGNTILSMSVEPENQNPHRLIIEDLHLFQEGVADVPISQLVPTKWKVIATSEPIMSEHADILDGEIIIRKQIDRETKEEQIPVGEEIPQAQRNTTATPFGDSVHTVLVNPRSRKVYRHDRVPYFERAESLLVFLHELAHVIESEKKSYPEDYSERQKYLDLHRKSPEEKLKEEISCWAFAIETIHKLRSQGFDFGEEFSDEIIRKCLDASLWSYGYKDDIQSLINYIFAVAELLEEDNNQGKAKV